MPACGGACAAARRGGIGFVRHRCDVRHCAERGGACRSGCAVRHALRGAGAREVPFSGAWRAGAAREYAERIKGRDSRGREQMVACRRGGYLSLEARRIRNQVRPVEEAYLRGRSRRREVRPDHRRRNPEARRMAPAVRVRQRVRGVRLPRALRRGEVLFPRRDWHGRPTAVGGKGAGRRGEERA